MPDSLPTLTATRLALRPMEPDDLEELTAIVTASEWGSFDSSLDDDGTSFVIEVDGRRAGWLGFYEEQEPDYRHASPDLVLAPAFQDRGFGPEALRAAIGWLVRERGHHPFTIDPGARNARAIAAYAKVGFKPVGVMREYERGVDGAWHDNLLMDLLAEELCRRPPALSSNGGHDHRNGPPSRRRERASEGGRPSRARPAARPRRCGL